MDSYSSEISTKYKCIHPRCNIYPSFNVKGQTKRLYCKNHKLPGMVDVNHKICDYENCKKIAAYNYIGLITSLYCKEHKQIVLIIKNKLCDYPKCSKIACVGLLWKTKSHCTAHKDANDYKINHPKCVINKCSDKPVYSNNTNYPSRCLNHKLDSDIYVTEQPCKNCGSVFYLNDVIRVCNYCNNIILYKKNKDITLMKKILKSFDISYDKISENIYDSYNPDFIFNYEKFICILEIDQINFVREYEIGRMIQLYKYYGSIPVIFIHFNNDSRISFCERTLVLINLLRNLNKYKITDQLTVITYIIC
jgi:hypothetical protein